jgi:intracellular sulfur oxidation DsrE/DsrF family protein
MKIIFNKKFGEELIAYFLSKDKNHIENDASNNSSIVACVFVAAVTFFTEPLPR